MATEKYLDNLLVALGVRKKEYFTCDHNEWRIRWEYVPNSQYSNLISFAVYTYPVIDSDRAQSTLMLSIR